MTALTHEQEQAIRAAIGDDPHPQDSNWSDVTVAALLAALDAERAANRTERDQWSRAAAVLDLAPYGGAYNPEYILPAVKALVDSNRDLRRRLNSTPLRPRGRFIAMPKLPPPPMGDAVIATDHHGQIMDQPSNIPTLYASEKGYAPPEPLVETAIAASRPASDSPLVEMAKMLFGPPASDRMQGLPEYTPLTGCTCPPNWPNKSWPHVVHHYQCARSEWLANPTCGVSGCETHSVAAEAYPTEKARLDADRTATGKTEIRGVTKLDEHGFASVNTTPLAHLDTETGKRSPLGEPFIPVGSDIAAADAERQRLASEPRTHGVWWLQEWSPHYGHAEAIGDRWVAVRHTDGSEDTRFEGTREKAEEIAATMNTINAPSRYEARVLCQRCDGTREIKTPYRTHGDGPVHRIDPCPVCAAPTDKEKP